MWKNILSGVHLAAKRPEPINFLGLHCCLVLHIGHQRIHCGTGLIKFASLVCVENPF
jgi:hypothetical protein